ncbi:PQQ-like beta-propeller repeat protein [Acidobacteria bacterium AH-259-O06]|nr:PQQ-like beta-propeller repeat protein [Acidobacteria bacterium AH-259-O06]
MAILLLSVLGCSCSQQTTEAASFKSHRVEASVSPATGEGLQPQALPSPTRKESSKRAILGEWPQWRGLKRDGISSETGLLTHWPREGLPVVWKVPGGEGFSSLAISEGRAYTIVDRDEAEWTLCLDAGSGKELWKIRSADSYKEYQGGNGPRSTPTVDGARVYTLGATGALLCLDKKAGNILWRRNILEDFKAPNLKWGTSTSPLVEGDSLLVNVGGSGASVVAFNKYTGEVVWKEHDDVAGYSSPIAITVDGVREIVFFGGRAILGLSPADGKLHWRHKWITLSDMNIATPIFSDPLLFISSGRGTGSGLFRLRRESDGVRADVQWTSKIMQNHFNSCLLVGEYLYGFHNSILKCIRLEDGEQMWADRSVGKGSLIYAQGHLFIMGERGDIGVAEATPEGYREHGRMRILEYKSWTPPALAGGRLYLRDQKYIACLNLRAGL